MHRNATQYGTIFGKMKLQWNARDDKAVQLLECVQGMAKKLITHQHPSIQARCMVLALWLLLNQLNSMIYCDDYMYVLATSTQNSHVLPYPIMVWCQSTFIIHFLYVYFTYTGAVQQGSGCGVWVLGHFVNTLEKITVRYRECTISNLIYLIKHPKDSRLNGFCHPTFKRLPRGLA